MTKNIKIHKIIMWIFFTSIIAFFIFYSVYLGYTQYIASLDFSKEAAHQVLKSNNNLSFWQSFWERVPCPFDSFHTLEQTAKIGNEIESIKEEIKESVNSGKWSTTTKVLIGFGVFFVGIYLYSFYDPTILAPPEIIVRVPPRSD